MGNLESSSKVGYLSQQESSGNTSRCYAILNGCNLSLYKSRDKAPNIVSLSEYKAIKKTGDAFQIIPKQANGPKLGFKCGSDIDEWCDCIQAAIDGDFETAETESSHKKKPETPKSVLYPLSIPCFDCL